MSAEFAESVVKVNEYSAKNAAIMWLGSRNSDQTAHRAYLSGSARSVKCILQLPRTGKGRSHDLTVWKPNMRCGKYDYCTASVILCCLN